MHNHIARRNNLLGALPAIEFEAVAGDLHLVDVSQREVIYEAGKPIHCVYFPIDCVLSIITVMENGDAVESGVVGREGFSAPQLMFGSNVPVTELICQVPGRAMVMRADALLTRFERLPTFRLLIFAYIESLFHFMGQSIACNRLHSLTQRFARWLLATHDRVGRNEFPLTQEFLAIMLGVARTAVTSAASTLAQAELISYNRGVISIVDREKLEQASCECYAVVANALAFNLKTPQQGSLQVQ